MTIPTFRVKPDAITFQFLASLMTLMLALSFATGCKRKKAAEATALPTPLISTATTPEEAVAELNRSLELWTFQRNTPPKDLNELVTAGYLKQLPTPPSGKKFAFDPAKMRVQLVAE